MMNEEQIYVRWQDRTDAAIQRLEKRALALERENETLRSRLANLELKNPAPPLESTQVPEEPRKKPGRKPKKE
ncbi:MAG: hypothetical protein PHC68_13330 [Syntrophorhabdaceae bacterium]|nr:hypothetical protein [Syntrophorhabdaceae bacterium]